MPTAVSTTAQVGIELQGTLHAEERLLPAAHLWASFHSKHPILSLWTKWTFSKNYNGFSLRQVYSKISSLTHTGVQMV